MTDSFNGLKTLLCSTLCLPLCTAYAQPVVQLEPFAVEDSRLAPIQFSASHQDIQTSQDLRKSNPAGLAMALQALPGIHLESDGSSAAPSEFFLHGGEPNFTVVSIDGIRLNNPTNTRGGLADYSIIDPWNIQQITLSSGSLSAIHGSDILTGLLHLQTLDTNAEPRQSIRAEAGSRGYFKLGLQAQQRHGPIDWLVGSSYLDEGEPTDETAYRARRFNTALQWQISDSSVLAFSGFYAATEHDLFPDDSGGPDLATIRTLEERSAHTGAASLRYINALSNLHTLEVWLSWYGQYDEADSPGVAPGLRDPFGIVPNAFENDFTRFQLEAFDRIQLSDTLSFVLGGEYMRESGDSESVLDLGGFFLEGSYELVRHTYSAFGEGRFNLTDFLWADAGLRVDWVEDFDTQASVRFALGAQIPNTTSMLQLSWGNAYKRPSFFALANPVVGNPNLNDEEAQSVQLQWSATALEGDLAVRASAFYYDYDTLVDFSPGPPPQLVNVEGVQIKGMDASIRLQLPASFALSAFASLLDFETPEANDRLLNRPRWRSGFRVDYEPLDNLTLQWRQSFTGARFDSSIPTGELRLASRTRSDFVASYTLSEQWRGVLSLDNVTNADYDTRIGLPEIGRRVRIQVEFSL